MKVFVSNVNIEIRNGQVESTFSVRVTGKIKDLEDSELNRISNTAQDLHGKAEFDARAYPVAKDWFDR
ncbi:MAG: hypothetical protein HY323_08200 [Betaproteobacteria bacterium]|nr:hypothetical protein [Betaproteobacteria bacterium]